MNNIILFDDIARLHLLPLTYTRPVANLRCGIFTIIDKWKSHVDGNFSFLTVPYLQKKFPTRMDSINVLINGSLLPDKELINTIFKLNVNDILMHGNDILACVLNSNDVIRISQNDDYIHINPDSYFIKHYDTSVRRILHPWDIFSQNEKNISDDFALITQNRVSKSISDSNRTIKPENIFIEDGAKIEFSIINAESGPVYIAKDAEVMENSVIRGPFALLDHSVVKMGAKIYGPTTIGPHSKVGGELNNVVIQGFSNKAHDGFLGNSVIGEWCNLGADTNNSNLKNTYEEVKLWSHYSEHFEKTGLQFCGLIMGDHSKCGINTMFNTGTVVGVSANIFGSGFQRNFIPSFSWGGILKMTTYQPEKAFQVAKNVMNRRGIIFNDIEKEILSCIFHMTTNQRHGL